MNVSSFIKTYLLLSYSVPGTELGASYSVVNKTSVVVVVIGWTLRRGERIEESTSCINETKLSETALISVTVGLPCAISRDSPSANNDDGQ